MGKSGFYQIDKIRYIIREIKMNEKVYLICPVRNCSAEVQQEIEWYVNELEKNGKEVHYPPRDVDQSQSEFIICHSHKMAMKDCDEIHIWWDNKSTGSHFDLGMAFMLLEINPSLIFVLANPQDVPKTIQKSFGNLIRNISHARDCTSINNLTI